MDLPIFEVAEKISASLEAENRILLKAPTGSGKSTETPSILANSQAIAGQILVIQPRRMAARLLANHVAKKRDTTLGDGVGYAVRFEKRYSVKTKIIFLTDGVFQRMLSEDPKLNGIGAVIFDEFHERRLSTDIALGKCLTLQQEHRSDLRIVVMSATLESNTLADFMQPVTQIEAKGRTFPVEIEHRTHRLKNDRSGASHREVPIWEKIRPVAEEALKHPDCGNVLIFLPGAYEIQRTSEMLQALAKRHGYQIFPLYSGLPQEKQNAAVATSTIPKIVVSTNVAETSLTIPGIRTVIDSGLARVASFDPRRGIDRLSIQKISRASADQRAGRAGRTAPGLCLRLWSVNDHARRREFDTPEIHRIDLAPAMLDLKCAGFRQINDFPWIDSPKSEAIERAHALLTQLGALQQNSELTSVGERMARLPLEPRYARLLLAGEENGCLPEMLFIAACIQSEGVFARGKNSHRADYLFEGDYTDFIGEYRAFSTARDLRFDVQRLQPMGIHARGARDLEKVLNQIAQHFPSCRGANIDFAGKEQAVGTALLAAFSDQVAVRNSLGNRSCRLTGNRKGLLDGDSHTLNAPLIVACEIAEVEARETVTHLRMLTACQPEWLSQIFPDEFSQIEAVAYDDRRRRVVRRNETRFRDLVIESSDSDHEVDLDQAAELLAEKVISGELILKNWDAKVEQFTARLQCIANWMPELEMPTWTDSDRVLAIAQICHGAISYKEIKDAAVWPVLNDWLSTPQRQLLDLYCPERLKLKTGHSAKITYSAQADPFFSAKLAQLIGTEDTPTIANGSVPLLVHVLAPNQRPWQMTKDLRNFWKSGYPQMKKELAGRYPRHPWP